jgi:transcription termination/antitermination protein NusG
MTDGLKRDTLTAPDDIAKSEAAPNAQNTTEAPQAENEPEDAARSPDISIGDMETDLPTAPESAAITEGIEIPWGEATPPGVAVEETSAPEAQTKGETSEEVARPVSETAGEAVAEAPAPAAPYKRAWYVVHCYSGYENKVKKGLEQRIISMGMQDRIFRVVVPIEKEVEIKEGQRRNIERRVFPGYILVEMMELQQGEPVSDEAWYVVRNTPGVTGFVSSGDKPVPLREDEVAKILKRMESEEPKVHVTFRSGQTVHIIDGPFADFRGTVDNVDMTKGKVRVLVSFFGRETPVELDLLQVEKV